MKKGRSRRRLPPPPAVESSSEETSPPGFSRSGVTSARDLRKVKATESLERQPPSADIYDDLPPPDDELPPDSPPPDVDEAPPPLSKPNANDSLSNSDMPPPPDSDEDATLLPPPQASPQASSGDSYAGKFRARRVLASRGRGRGRVRPRGRGRPPYNVPPVLRRLGDSSPWGGGGYGGISGGKKENDDDDDDDAWSADESLDGRPAQVKGTLRVQPEPEEKTEEANEPDVVGGDVEEESPPAATPKESVVEEDGGVSSTVLGAETQSAIDALRQAAVEVAALLQQARQAADDARSASMDAAVHRTHVFAVARQVAALTPTSPASQSLRSLTLSGPHALLEDVTSSPSQIRGNPDALEAARAIARAAAMEAREQDDDDDDSVTTSASSESSNSSNSSNSSSSASASTESSKKHSEEESQLNVVTDTETDSVAGPTTKGKIAAVSPAAAPHENDDEEKAATEQAKEEEEGDILGERATTTKKVDEDDVLKERSTSTSTKKVEEDDVLKERSTSTSTKKDTTESTIQEMKKTVAVQTETDQKVEDGNEAEEAQGESALVAEEPPGTLDPGALDALELARRLRAARAQLEAAAAQYQGQQRSPANRGSPPGLSSPPTPTHASPPNTSTSPNEEPDLPWSPQRKPEDDQHPQNPQNPQHPQNLQNPQNLQHPQNSRVPEEPKEEEEQHRTAAPVPATHPSPSAQLEAMRRERATLLAVVSRVLGALDRESASKLGLPPQLLDLAAKYRRPAPAAQARPNPRPQPRPRTSPPEPNPDVGQDVPRSKRSKRQTPSSRSSQGSTSSARQRRRRRRQRPEESAVPPARPAVRSNQSSKSHRPKQLHPSTSAHSSKARPRPRPRPAEPSLRHSPQKKPAVPRQQPHPAPTRLGTPTKGNKLLQDIFSGPRKSTTSQRQPTRVPVEVSAQDVAALRTRLEKHQPQQKPSPNLSDNTESSPNKKRPLTPSMTATTSDDGQDDAIFFASDALNSPAQGPQPAPASDAPITGRSSASRAMQKRKAISSPKEPSDGDGDVDAESFRVERDAGRAPAAEAWGGSAVSSIQLHPAPIRRRSRKALSADMDLTTPKTSTSPLHHPTSTSSPSKQPIHRSRTSSDSSPLNPTTTTTTPPIGRYADVASSATNKKPQQSFSHDSTSTANTSDEEEDQRPPLPPSKPPPPQDEDDHSSDIVCTITVGLGPEKGNRRVSLRRGQDPVQAAKDMLLQEQLGPSHIGPERAGKLVAVISSALQKAASKK